MLPPKTRCFSANTGEAPAGPSTWGWFTNRELAWHCCSMEIMAGDFDPQTPCLLYYHSILIMWSSSSLKIFSSLQWFLQWAALLLSSPRFAYLRITCAESQSPHQPANDPDLSLQGRGPLSTIPIPVGFAACLLRGLTLIHAKLQVRKDTPVNYTPWHYFSWRARAQAPWWIHCVWYWAHIVNDRQCLKKLFALNELQR